MVKEDFYNLKPGDWLYVVDPEISERVNRNWNKGLVTENNGFRDHNFRIGVKWCDFSESLEPTVECLDIPISIFTDSNGGLERYFYATNEKEQLILEMKIQ